MADSERTDGGPPPEAPPAAPSTDLPIGVPSEADLKHTHPLTVAVKTGRSLFQALLFFIAFAFFRSGGLGGWAGPAIGAFIFLATAVVVGLSWLSWSRFFYGIVGNDLLILEGILVHKRRSIPLSRIQGVDVRADLFNRVLGLVELRVQTAGGGDEPEAKISSIPLADAEVLRAALLRGHKTAAEVAGATVSEAGVPTFGEHPTTRLSDFRGALGGAEIAREEASYEFSLSLGRLVLSAVTSKQVTIILAIVIGASTQVVEFVGPEVFEGAASTLTMLSLPLMVGVILMVLVIGLGIAVLVAVGKTWGFVARRVGNRIETEAGLLERRMTSLPTRRIQAVSIEETWIRRLLGYQSVLVQTAGFGKGDENRGGLSTAAVVPIAKREEIGPLMHGLLPEAEDFPAAHGLPRKSLRFYIFVPTLVTLLIALPIVALLGLLFLPGGIAAGAAALVVAGIVGTVRWLNWRAAGIGHDEEVLTVRSGVIGHRRVRLGRSRIQSLHVRQNPFQRRAGLADLVTLSVSGSGRSRHGVRHMPHAEAQRILEWFEAGTAASMRPATPASVHPAASVGAQPAT